ncbi:hypothetical protein OG311_38120 (plasmid) [Streptomyces sp. NBC_01343]|uniref:hypothetical protein n=1 Tax=Streptomyces sp. NBC_01343 TaxID=2903832 RepID=UPI002E122AC8|nr:hypothetical protein OG311_38120 [Streptomyces sp. NBC_01343]
MAGQERTVAQLALAALFGPRKDAAEPDAVSVAAPAGPELPAPVPLMRFLTVGHAVVEVHTHRFTTRYTCQGRPYADPANPREVEGFRWKCGGCGATGETDGSSGPRFDYGRYLPEERDQVRADANAHATVCRAMAPTALG